MPGAAAGRAGRQPRAHAQYCDGRPPGGRRADVLHCAQPLHAASGWHPGAADRPRRPTRTAACTALPVAAAPAGMACAVPV